MPKSKQRSMLGAASGQGRWCKGRWCKGRWTERLKERERETEGERERLRD